MRTAQQVLNQVLEFATKDERVRGVLLCGSRANANARIDRLSDFDIIYVVKNVSAFTSDHSWINMFGERLLLQMPKEMESVGDESDSPFSYLMLFSDHHRIDLSLLPVEKLNLVSSMKEQVQILLDKDQLFSSIPLSHANFNEDKPSERHFLECCNEFWWVSIYVAKGLWRKEFVYARQMLDGVVRRMFMRMIEWHVGVASGFTASFGKEGRNIQHLVSHALYKRILATYPDATIENTWKALFQMIDIFDELARENAAALDIGYNDQEATNAKRFAAWIYSGEADQ